MQFLFCDCDDYNLKTRNFLILMSLLQLLISVKMQENVNLPSSWLNVSFSILRFPLETMGYNEFPLGFLHSLAFSCKIPRKLLEPLSRS